MTATFRPRNFCLKIYSRIIHRVSLLREKKVNNNNNRIKWKNKTDFFSPLWNSWKKLTGPISEISLDPLFQKKDSKIGRFKIVSKKT